MASRPDGVCRWVQLALHDQIDFLMPSNSRSAGRQSLIALVEQFRETEAEITLGGGRAAIERQHAKGRLTARERIERLLDPGTPFSNSACGPAGKCTPSGAAPRRPASSAASARSPVGGT